MVLVVATDDCPTAIHIVPLYFTSHTLVSKNCPGFLKVIPLSKVKSVNRKPPTKTTLVLLVICVLADMIGTYQDD